HDLVTGTTERVSLDFMGAQLGGAGLVAAGGLPGLSADGRFVGFLSAASGVVQEDVGVATHVYVRDRIAGTNTCASVSSAGVGADDGSFFPALSADARVVAFMSLARNLVPGDVNRCRGTLCESSVAGPNDIFVRDDHCGDGIVDPGEQCDDGNAIAGD